jgi:hypothetical protein
MPDEFDEATQSETIRIVVATRVQPVARDGGSRAARLVARLYGGMNAVHRSRLLLQLLRPLGPLARVAVASGAFAGVVGRGMGQSAASALDDLARFSTEQVFELARFVEQASPEALRRIAAAVAAHPPGASALTAAAALLLMRLLQDREAAPAAREGESPAP